MNKKRTTKSKAAKSMRNLPEKAVSAKDAKNVKGGTGFSYGGIKIEYKPQKDDGTLGSWRSRVRRRAAPASSCFILETRQPAIHIGQGAR